MFESFLSNRPINRPKITQKEADSIWNIYRSLYAKSDIERGPARSVSRSVRDSTISTTSPQSWAFWVVLSQGTCQTSCPWKILKVTVQICAARSTRWKWKKSGTQTVCGLEISWDDWISSLKTFLSSTSLCHGIHLEASYTVYTNM